MATEYTRRMDEFLNELIVFSQEFGGETDRAFVILGAAKLELLLQQILLKKLLAHPGGNDELFDGDAPLSTFNAKINMSYRLGLIGAEFARALHLVRRIRNSFAHELSGATLNSGPHRDRISELSRLFDNTWIIGTMKGYREFARESDASATFSAILYLLMSRLQQAIYRCDTLPSDKAMPLIHRHWVGKADPNKPQE